MSKDNNVIPAAAITQSTRPATAGLLAGALGVLAFSFTLPATRFGEAGGLSAVWLGPLRAVPAGLLALLLIACSGGQRPTRNEIARLCLVASGVVFGFPYFAALALTHTSAAHAAVVVGLLPAATAVCAVLRAREQPPLEFWLAALGGLGAILIFAAASGAGRPGPGDLYALVAVALGGTGYAEGGLLARRLGGPAVICWALVLSLPVLLPFFAFVIARGGWPAATAGAWVSYAYVSLVSMLLGFFVWYRGLAEGGIARIGQLQLAQPILTLAWSFLLLGERVTAGMAAAALAVLGFVVLTQRTRAATR